MGISHIVDSLRAIQWIAKGIEAISFLGQLELIFMFISGRLDHFKILFQLWYTENICPISGNPLLMISVISPVPRELRKSAGWVALLRPVVAEKVAAI